MSVSPAPKIASSSSDATAQGASPPPKTESYLVEVFSAIQGEGPIVGTRQIFIRYLGCHIQCAYCDTPATHTKQRQCRVERTPGLRDFEPMANPVAHSDLMTAIDQLEHFAGLHDSISITGGEPLQHLRSLNGLIPLLKPRFSLYLETDGILYDALAVVADEFDWIGMDMKLPSATGLQPYWEEHQKFLAIAARSQSQVFVKLVVSQKTPDSEIQQAIDIIAAEDPSLLLVIQPVTPYGIVRHPPTPEQILRWQGLAKQSLKNVRVIPQTHKIMGQI